MNSVDERYLVELEVYDLTDDSATSALKLKFNLGADCFNADDLRAAINEEILQAAEDGLIRKPAVKNA